MYCQKCGHELSPNSRFCDQCGTQTIEQNQASDSFPVAFYMNPKGITMTTYRFAITDSNGNQLYIAETLPSAYTYKMHICDNYGNEVMLIQQSKKLTFTAMNFEIWQNGKMISEVKQQTHFTKYVYSLPQLGFEARGDFFAMNFQISFNGTPIATISKKMMAWGDSYEIVVNYPQYSEVILGFVMAIQMVTIRIRHRR